MGDATKDLAVSWSAWTGMRSLSARDRFQTRGTPTTANAPSGTDLW
jgi:hypothetical protein